jgi:hypothetical protein
MDWILGLPPAGTGRDPLLPARRRYNNVTDPWRRASMSDLVRIMVDFDLEAQIYQTWPTEWKTLPSDYLHWCKLLIVRDRRAFRAPVIHWPTPGPANGNGWILLRTSTRSREGDAGERHRQAKDRNRRTIHTRTWHDSGLEIERRAFKLPMKQMRPYPPAQLRVSQSSRPPAPARSTAVPGRSSTIQSRQARRRGRWSLLLPRRRHWHWRQREGPRRSSRWCS